MVNHPSIFPSIRDDRQVEPFDCEPLNTPQNLLLELWADGREAGFAILLRRGETIFEMHSGLLPEYRGRRAILIGKQIVSWVSVTKLVTKLTTFVWDSAKNVLFVTRAIGFKEDCRGPWPHTVNGRHVQQVSFSIDFPN